MKLQRACSNFEDAQVKANIALERYRNECGLLYDTLYGSINNVNREFDEIGAYDGPDHNGEVGPL